MRRRCVRVALSVACLAVAVSAIQAQQTEAAVLDQARSSFAQGNAAEADQKLDSILKDNPVNLGALSLKGIILDSQQHYAEADRYYRRALAIAPRSAQVLNNLGNHFLTLGDRAQARQFYLKAIAIDPQHANANLQLAQMSVDDKHGREALVYLNHLPEAAIGDAGTMLLKARALVFVGQCSDAAQALNNVEGKTGAAPGVAFSAGLVFAQCKLYDRAEASFSRALDAEPTNFDVLYNLGLASLEAGHSERATNVLQTALQQRPHDPDCLYGLARAYVQQHKPMDAAGLLAQAHKLAPQRADVLLLLAQVSAQLQFFVDAAQTYDAYLKLKPNDDAARRERGFMLACANQFKRGVPDLEWYVRRHPRDAVGFYELGAAKSVAGDRSSAFTDLGRALELDPELAQARYARALLSIQEQRPAAAAEDLNAYLQRQPNDARALAHLGQAYLDLGKSNEAADVLKHAVEVEPTSPVVLLQYRRALIRLGRTQEAEAMLARLKQSESDSNGRRPEAGLMQYLNLAPAERRSRYLAGLRAECSANRDDLACQLRLGRELFSEGATPEAIGIFEQLKSSATEPQLAAQCGRVLLDFEQYDLARPFLERALVSDPSLSNARLDLAIVRFHLQSPTAALAELDQTPPADRKGDYYLVRAQILDALGNVEGAVQALNHGMRVAPTRPDLYLQAAGFLVKHNLVHEALDLLQQASLVLPDAKEILLAQAVTLDLARREPDALKLLARIQTRWPEWDQPYVVSGMLLEIALKSAEARQTLENAIALGANTPEVYYYLARAILHATPDHLDAAQSAIQHAVELNPKDPYVLLLAGKISFEKKEYSKAVALLLAAKRLQPTLIPACYALRDTYKALGEEQKAAAEIDDIKRLAKANPQPDTNPFAIENFLFGVRPPG